VGIVTGLAPTGDAAARVVGQRAAILARVGEARAALAEVESIEETLRIAGFAESIRHAARQARAGVELENAAMEVRLRAERRAGELLVAIPKNAGGRPRTGPRVVRVFSEPTLAELGVSKRQSSTFQQVAGVPERVFEEYVSAPSGRLSRNALLREDRRAGQHAPVTPPPLPVGEWNVLLADPPWRYEENSVQPYWQIESQYPTLALEEICALRVPAAEQAVLFLWATAPKLPDALQVMAAWGFAYRTNAVWVKHRPGMGYYFRGRHELLLVGRRGEMPVPEPGCRPDSVVDARRGRHSEKPEIVHALIEAMYPNAARLELFARRSRPGWDSWGWNPDTATTETSSSARSLPPRGAGGPQGRLPTPRGCLPSLVGRRASA
jgi:N6-adenosine-specific RNA methylase IME4